MRPYCTPRDCMGYGDLLACDGCRLEAACNAMGIALCIAGLAAQLFELESERTIDESPTTGALWDAFSACIAAHDFGHTEDT